MLFTLLLHQLLICYRYQCTNPTIIVWQHDQGASIPIILLIKITIHPLSTDGAIVIWVITITASRQVSCALLILLYGCHFNPIWYVWGSTCFHKNGHISLNIQIKIALSVDEVRILIKILVESHMAFTQKFEIQLSMSSQYASHNQVDISGNREIFWCNSDFPCDLSLISSGIMTNHW